MKMFENVYWVELLGVQRALNLLNHLAILRQTSQRLPDVDLLQGLRLDASDSSWLRENGSPRLSFRAPSPYSSLGSSRSPQTFGTGLRAADRHGFAWQWQLPRGLPFGVMMIWSKTDRSLANKASKN